MASRKGKKNSRPPLGLHANKLCQDLMPDPYFFLRRMTNVANVKCLDLTPISSPRCVTTPCSSAARGLRVYFVT